ncbi:MAG TPA: mercuric transporter MerT family protein [Gemmatimonadales bacterium]
MEQVRPLPPGSTDSRKLSALTVGGAIVSGLLASACCPGPLVLAALGIGGAGLLAKFEAYRPIFTVGTFGLLGVGFWVAYRKPKVAVGDACGCEYPKANRLGRVLLWVAAIVAVAVWAFPYVAERIFG